MEGFVNRNSFGLKTATNRSRNKASEQLHLPSKQYGERQNKVELDKIENWMLKVSC